MNHSIERYLSAAASPLTIDTVAPGRSADVVPVLLPAAWGLNRAAESAGQDKRRGAANV